MRVDWPGWEGWYFEGDYLCSPNGDRFTPECVLACFFVRQMRAFGEVLYGRPSRLDDDVVLEATNRRIENLIQAQAELISIPAPELLV